MRPPAPSWRQVGACPPGTCPPGAYHREMSRPNSSVSAQSPATYMRCFMVPNRVRYALQGRGGSRRGARQGGGQRGALQAMRSGAGGSTHPSTILLCWASLPLQPPAAFAPAAAAPAQPSALSHLRHATHEANPPQLKAGCLSSPSSSTARSLPAGGSQAGGGQALLALAGGTAEAQRKQRQLAGGSDYAAIALPQPAHPSQAV